MNRHNDQASGIEAVDGRQFDQCSTHTLRVHHTIEAKRIATQNEVAAFLFGVSVDVGVGVSVGVGLGGITSKILAAKTSKLPIPV